MTKRSRPRPRNQKKSEAKDRLFEYKRSRGQGHEWPSAKPRIEDTIFLNFDRLIFHDF